jgi:LRR receptor-like serine/threonine-protein kinase FLS2
VRVVGYCSSPEIKALVLEYMPNGSLEKLLHPSPGAEVVQTFNWNARLNVAIGVAQGLAYLHHERAATTPLVHGNVKPSNILFDAKWRARISDFGMSTILAPGAGASGGASGYIPPGKKEPILTISVIQPSSCCQSSSKNCITIQTFFSVFSQE